MIQASKTKNKQKHVFESIANIRPSGGNGGRGLIEDCFFLFLFCFVFIFFFVFVFVLFFGFVLFFPVLLYPWLEKQ